MGITVLLATLVFFAAAMLLIGRLVLRPGREEYREERTHRAASEAAFRSNGHTPDQILYCAAAGRRVQLLVDNCGGIFRVDILDGADSGRRDVWFRDLIGCQVLENGVTAAYAGHPITSSAVCDGHGAGPVHTMRLVLYLNDALEPVFWIDLLLSPVSRGTPAYREAAGFAAEVLKLTRRILAEGQTPHPERAVEKQENTT